MQSISWLGIILGLLTALSVGAEPKTGDGGAAIKKAQGLIRQLSQEKSSLEAEKSAWLLEKTALEAKLKSHDLEVRKLQPLQAEVERYKTGMETLKTSLESQIGQERQNRQALAVKHNEMIGKANAIYADNLLLVQAVKEREQWIEQCTSRNQKLRTVSLEILERYREKGFLQQLAELEPLTGIGQVETEVGVEDYKYQLKHLQLTPFKGVEAEREIKAALPIAESDNSSATDETSIKNTEDSNPGNNDSQDLKPIVPAHSGSAPASKP